jgi:hypothetical protein
MSYKFCLLFPSEIEFYIGEDRKKRKAGEFLLQPEKRGCTRRGNLFLLCGLLRCFLRCFLCCHQVFTPFLPAPRPEVRNAHHL